MKVQATLTIFALVAIVSSWGYYGQCPDSPSCRRGNCGWERKQWHWHADKGCLCVSCKDEVVTCPRLDCPELHCPQERIRKVYTLGTGCEDCPECEFTCPALKCVENLPCPEQFRRTNIDPITGCKLCSTCPCLKAKCADPGCSNPEPVTYKYWGKECPGCPVCPSNESKRGRN